MTAHRYPGGIISASAPTVTSNSAVGVWTVEEAVRYKAAGTWPDGTGTDPYFNYTTLLLHGDGTNGAQNNTFLDGSTNNFTITRNGNTTQGSYSPYVGPGCWSIFFNGTTDYLTSTSVNIVPAGTESFTIEMWMYKANAWNAVNQLLFFGAPTGIQIWVDAATNTLKLSYNNALILSYSAASLSTNTWYHLAIARNGSAIAMYINGSQVASGTDSTSIPAPTSVIIGNYNSGTSNVWSGYISNLRIVRGVALYTAAFTAPTTPLVATSQTTLLYCNNNGFNDFSGGNISFTRSGTPQVSKFSPFTLYQTNPASYSGYFDGTGDYLSLSTATAFGVGTGDFTIEYWAFYNTFASSPIGFDTRSTSGDTTPSDYVTTGGNLVFYYNSTNLLTSTNAAVLGRWNHIAWVRSGTTLTSYINGVASGSVTSSANFGTTQPLRIAGNITAANFLNGSISNFRFVKGTAVYTTGFTPPTAPLTAISGTSLLTCQSTTFIDNSTNAFTITANGNATPKRANPFTDTVTGPTQYATTTYGGSAYFDGTGDYLTVPTSAGLNLGASDFTMEGWVYLSATQSSKYLFGVGTVDGTTRSAAVWIGGTQKVEGYFSADGSTWLSYRVGTTTVAANQWAHVAFVRSGTTLYLFLNGALEGTQTGTPTTAASGYPAYIGGQSATYQLNGYLSNIRIVKGTALYTAPFVPPAAPVTAVTNTQLLVNGTNAGIFDNTTVNDLETVGSAQVSTSVVKYGTGSMSFNGTNSYLTARTTPTMAMGTGNFTIEYWINATSFSTTPTIIDFRGSANNLGFSDYITTAGQINIWKNTGSILSATSNLTTGTWYFIAYVRNNGTLTIYINGVASGSVADTTNWVAPSDVMNIASYKAGTGGYFNGYLDDIRVTLGYARYTTNFTPPTGPFPNI